MIRPSRFFSFFALFFLLCTGCQSVSIDQSPNTVLVEGLTVQERLDLQNDLKKRLASTEAIFNQSREIIKNFQRISPAVPGKQVYTPVDFLIDLNVAATETLPKATRTNDGTVSYKTKIQLPDFLTTANCQSLHSKIVYKVDPTGDTATLNYSLKSCDSKDKYVDVVTMSWIGDQIFFALNKEGLREVFGDLFSAKIRDQYKCSGNFEGNQLVSFECSNLNFQLSATEDAQITELKYSLRDTTRVLAKAQIFENGLVKAFANLVVNDRMEIRFDIQKTAPEAVELNGLAPSNNQAD